MLFKSRLPIYTTETLSILLRKQHSAGELENNKDFSVCYSITYVCAPKVGPTCGLVALSMLLGGSPTADDLLKDAIDQEYTLNGELFSAQYLFELTRKHMPGPAACQLHVGPLDCKKVKELLKAGGCLLVPYPFSKILPFKPGLSLVFPCI